MAISGFFCVCFLCVSIYVAVFHLFLSPGWAGSKCVFLTVGGGIDEIDVM